ncbi:zinc-binding dehydrogenase [Streptacidiphilus sp. 4-A2]|nr:zinc-binding dehydrogenase [Streptacidiphilus sp. 4-A2]
MPREAGRCPRHPDRRPAVAAGHRPRRRHRRSPHRRRLRRRSPGARGGARGDRRSRADLVIECAGVPDAVEQGTRMVRRGGAYLIVGQYTDSGNTSFNPHQIVYRQLDVIGSWAFSGAHLGEYIRMLPELVERFGLRSLVTEFPFPTSRQPWPWWRTEPS